MAAGAAAPDLGERFVPERPLGRGGQGEVWLAFDRELDRWVAVKVFGTDLGATARERLRREVRLGQTAQHPRIVPLYELLDAGGRPAVVMEWLPGGTLRDRVAHGPLPVAEVVAALRDVLEALAFLHRRQVVHRDVKPSNLFVDADGRVRLGDLGLALPLDGTPRVTRLDGAVGTPQYMSPEQVLGAEPAPASDLYALGLTAWRLLTGEHPLGDGDDLQIAERQVHARVAGVATRRSDCPRWLGRFVDRLLEKRPGDRWPDAGSALAAFERRRVRLSPRRVRRVAAATALATAVPVAAAWLASDRRMPPASAWSEGSAVIAEDARGREIWRRELGGTVRATMIADLLDDTAPEVAAATSAADRTVGEVKVLSATGDVVASTPVLPDGGWRVGRTVVPGPAIVEHLLVLHPAAGRPAAAAWLLRHPDAQPGMAAAWRPRDAHATTLLLNSGHLTDALVLDADGDGDDELMVGGINNRLLYQRVVAVVDLEPPPAERDGRGGAFTTSPDDVDAWYQGIHGSGRLGPVLSYVPLGSADTFATLRRLGDGRLVLRGTTSQLELDSWGDPAGSPLYGGGPAPRTAFWCDLAQLCAAVERGTGDRTAALEAFRENHRRVLSEAGSEVAAAALVARSLARSGQVEAAVEIMTEVHRRHPAWPALSLRRAALTAAAGDRLTALTLLLDLLDQNDVLGPTRVAAFVQLARLAALEDRPDAVAAGHGRLRRTGGLELPADVNFDVQALTAFFRGAWREPSLDRRLASVHVPDAGPARLWAALERGEGPAEVRTALATAADDELEPLTALVRARALELEGDAERALGVARPAAAEIAARARDDGMWLVWQPLAEWTVGRCLEALGRSDEARPHCAAAAAAAPATWLARSDG